MNRQDLEKKCDEKGLDAPRVTQEHVERLITDEAYHQFPGTTVTVCLLTLQNGFTTTGTSACADPSNFDAELGKEWAKKKAQDEIWKLEGYLLKDRLHNASK